MYANGYDALGNRLFKVNARTEKKVKELLNIYWDSDTSLVVLFKDNGNQVKILYDLVRGGLLI